MEKSQSQIDVSEKLLYNPRRDHSMRSVLKALQEVRAELSCGVDANKFRSFTTENMSWRVDAARTGNPANRY